MVDKANKFLPFIAILVVLWLLFTIFSNIPEDNTTPKISLLSPQLSALPAGFPREGKKEIPAFDPRFIKLSPLTTFKVPRATVFSAPMGTHTGMFTYNAQGYWEDNPHRRGHHTGEDLNGIGGWNSDLGDDVYSVADGLVVYSGIPSPGWGNVIILAHRVEKEGADVIVQSLYAHLKERHVTVDQFIPRGKIIGSVGSANGQYLAHLHFEMREGTNLHIGPGYLRSKRTHFSPSVFLSPNFKREVVFSNTRVREKDWQDVKMNNIELVLPVLEK